MSSDGSVRYKDSPLTTDINCRSLDQWRLCAGDHTGHIQSLVMLLGEVVWKPSFWLDLSSFWTWRRLRHLTAVYANTHSLYIQQTTSRRLGWHILKVRGRRGLTLTVPSSTGSCELGVMGVSFSFAVKIQEDLAALSSAFLLYISSFCLSLHSHTHCDDVNMLLTNCVWQQRLKSGWNLQFGDCSCPVLPSSSCMIDYF